MKQFNLPETAADDLDTPRMIETQLHEQRANRYYSHSILLTGVDKLSVYNPYNPYVIFNNKRKSKLPHGIEGYVCNLVKLTHNCYIIHVLRYNPDTVKSTHNHDYLMYLLKCGNLRCSVA